MRLRARDPSRHVGPWQVPAARRWFTVLRFLTCHGPVPFRSPGYELRGLEPSEFQFRILNECHIGAPLETGLWRLVPGDGIFAYSYGYSCHSSGRHGGLIISHAELRIAHPHPWTTLWVNAAIALGPGSPISVSGPVGLGFVEGSFSFLRMKKWSPLPEPDLQMTRNVPRPRILHFHYLCVCVCMYAQDRAS